MNPEKKHGQDNADQPDQKKTGKTKSAVENKNPRKDVETLKQEDSPQTNKNDLIPPKQA